MKVLFLTPGCFDKGGISRYSRYQITALREIHGDAQVRVLSLLGPDEHSFESPFLVRWHGQGASVLSKIAFSWRNLRECLLWRPDVIHCAHVNFSGLAVALARLAGAKSVLNIYGLEMWSGLSRDALWGLERVDLIISDCHATADYVKEQRWRTSEDIPVIWDCVDLDRFQPGSCPDEIYRKYQIPQSKFIVLTLGRLSQTASHKGYERLLEAFSLAAPRLPDAVLVFAGRGDLREKLEKRAEEMGLTPRVCFTGSVEEDDLPDIYRSAQVFSLVSDRGPGRGEGIPLTPLEAMACGTPILVGNQDGSREAVMEGRNGVVLDPFDLENHAAALVALASDEPRRLAMADEAARVACDCFSYPGFRDKLKDVYQRHLL